MKRQRTVNWQKLAAIEELQEFFAEDFQGFKQLIEANIETVEQFSEEALDKFAKLRVLEITNGCTQGGFRYGDPQCLSVEQTRECMNLVMGFIKRAELYFPSEGHLEFDPEQQAFIAAGRDLYQDAFKNNVRESQRKYYAASTAQLIVYGHERLQQAMTLVKQDYEPLFSAHYLARAQAYITPYLSAFQ